MKLRRNYYPCNFCGQDIVVKKFPNELKFCSELCEKKFFELCGEENKTEK